jgi:hypothetical protein
MGYMSHGFLDAARISHTLAGQTASERVSMNGSSQIYPVRVSAGG